MAEAVVRKLGHLSLCRSPKLVAVGSQVALRWSYVQVIRTALRSAGHWISGRRVRLITDKVPLRESSPHSLNVLPSSTSITIIMATIVLKRTGQKACALPSDTIAHLIAD